MRARRTTKRWPRARTSGTPVGPRCTRTAAFRATSRACSGLASPKKAAEGDTNSRGEGAEPKAVPASGTGGAFTCRREAVSECERRTAEHQRGLLGRGDGRRMWPAQPPVGVPQETIQQSVRKSLKSIKSNNGIVQISTRLVESSPTLSKVSLGTQEAFRSLYPKPTQP